MSTNLEAAWAELAPLLAKRRASVADAIRALDLPPVGTEVGHELDELGYAFVQHATDEQTCQRLADQIMRYGDAEGEGAASGGHIEIGATRVTDLLSRSEAFDRFVFEPRVLSLVSYLLEDDVQLSTLTARAPDFENGDQRVHRDWHTPMVDGRCQAVNVIWALDQFTRENGATEVVPRTQALQDPGDASDRTRRSDSVLAEMPRGTALVYNAHLWHRGTRNVSGARRVAIHAFFTRSCYPQICVLAERLDPDARSRFSPPELSVLNLPESRVA